MRLLAFTDLDALVTLDAEAHPPQLWTRAQYQEEIERERGGLAIGVTSAAGELVGMLFMSVVLDEAMVTNLAVARSVRRRGLASRLLDAAVIGGRAAGVTTFVLEVRQANRAARALYESRGFAQAGTRRGYYQAPRDNAAVLLLRCANDAPGAAPSEDSGQTCEADGGPLFDPDVSELALKAGLEVGPFALRPLWP
jgi:ribosomal-protein-alanine N-acetyltransferase